MYWQPLIFVAYLASMPALFIAWAALEIKLHPDKYRGSVNPHMNTDKEIQP